MLAGTAVYGTVRTVVWEDGGGDPASYPIVAAWLAAWVESLRVARMIPFLWLPSFPDCILAVTDLAIP